MTFHFHVGFSIDIRASDVNMAKDRLNDCRRIAGLKQMHSFRMTHGMRTDILNYGGMVTICSVSEPCGTLGALMKVVLAV